MKILRNVEPPPPKRLSKEQSLAKEYKRLDPRSREIYEALPTIAVGDAIEIDGDVRAVARMVGAMVARRNREGANFHPSIVCQQRGDKVRVYFKQ